MSKRLAVGLVALGIVVGSGVWAFSRTERESGCPADRAVLLFGYTTDGTTFETLSDAAKVVAENEGYDELSASDLERIAQSSANADPSVSPTGIVTFTFDPDLPDTDMVVDLHIRVLRNEQGEYVPDGGSFCARVVHG
jgi:hypothetical protein